MGTRQIISRIYEEMDKSDSDLKESLSKLKEKNLKDSQAIESEIYKVIAERRLSVINDLLKILDKSVESSETQPSEKNNFISKLSR